MKISHKIMVVSVMIAGTASLISCKGRRTDTVEPNGDTVEVVIERNVSTNEVINHTDTVTDTVMVPAAVADPAAQQPADSI